MTPRNVAYIARSIDTWNLAATGSYTEFWFVALHVTSDKPTQYDSLVATPVTTVMVLGTVDSSEKGVSNESNQRANIDVSKPTVQLNKHILLPTKSTNPLLSKQLPVGSCDSRSLRCHSSSSDPFNLSVS